jgi:hypothetical protein
MQPLASCFAFLSQNISSAQPEELAALGGACTSPKIAYLRQAGALVAPRRRNRADVRGRPTLFLLRKDSGFESGFTMPGCPQADAPCGFTQGSGKETTYGQHSYRIRGQALEGSDPIAR